MPASLSPSELTAGSVLAGEPLSLHSLGETATVNGLYKTGLIRARGPWWTADQVELATAGWVA
jgi:hypothetical protein